VIYTLEATEKHCLVRYRIDGMLQEFFKLEGIIFGPLNSRMKLLSNLALLQRRESLKIRRRLTKE